MIVVKIELWPGGDEVQARELERVCIYNDGTGTLEFGNYVGFIPLQGEPGAGPDAEETRFASPSTITVKNMPRGHEYLLYLVARVLRKLGG